MGTRHCKLTSSFTSTTNHMISAPFCQNAERIFTPARPLLDLSGFSCLVIRRLKHLLLLFCVCVSACVFTQLWPNSSLWAWTLPSITHQWTTFAGRGKKIINDLIFEICGKGRIWVTSLFSFFFWFYFFLLPPAAVQILEVSKNASINLRIINFLCREYAPVCECAPNCLCERLIYVIRLIWLINMQMLNLKMKLI